MPASVAELRQLAKRRLPRMLFDYVDGGSFDESTLRANERDFDEFTLSQSVLRDVSHRDLTARFLGKEHSLPLILGPVGFAGILSRQGEVQAAQAARQAGIPICLSTFSVSSMEHVRRMSDGTVYFQSYIFKDRSLGEELADRARQAEIDVLFLTVDASVSAIRERDVRNGFRIARRLPPRAIADFLLHPRWLWDIAFSGRPHLGNFSSQRDIPPDLFAQASALTAQLDPSLTWEDVRNFRRNWPGKLVLKGIMSVADARQAADCGVDGIVVSNHGGRQLNGGQSSIMALPDIAREVGGDIEIFFDGGIRRGSQVVKALALGADAVLLGRAYAYGLAALGRDGVSQAINLIAAEIDLTLALMGLSSVSELRRNGTAQIAKRLSRANPTGEPEL